MNNKTLYENIMAGINKSLKNCFMPLNESAFVMNAKSTSYIAQFIKFCLDDIDEYLKLCPPEMIELFDGIDAVEIYRELYRINVLSVNERYKEDEDISYIDKINFEGKIYKDMNDLLSDINICQILMSLQCWSYQSSEIEDSEIVVAVDGLIENLEMYIIGLYNVSNIDEIPEYENAKWN